MTDNDMTLADLQPGQTGIVTGLIADGVQRRRLMDLGLLPGTPVRAEMDSPLGDPTAYRIRGALIALRREQASLITITPPTEESQS